MSWIVALFFVEIGMVPNNQCWIREVEQVGVPLYYTDLGVEFQVYDNLFFLGGSVRTSQVQDGLQFDPLEAVYRVHAGLRYRQLEVGWERLCMHPITTYLWHKTEQLGHRPLVNYEGGYNRLYCRIQVEQTLF